MKFKTIFIYMLLTVVSCGKNGPQNLSVDKGNVYNTFRVSKSCSGVDFTQNYLLKNNVQKFFECLTWSEKYPALYEFVKNYDEENWLNLFGRFNQEVFSKDKIKNFLTYLVEQKNNGKLIGIQTAMEDLAKIDGLPDLALKFHRFLKQNDSYKMEKILSDSNLALLLKTYKNLIISLNSNKKNLKEISRYTKEEIEFDQIKLLDIVSTTFLQNSKETSSKLGKFFVGVDGDWIYNHFLRKEPLKTKYVLDFAFNNLDRTKSLITSVRSIIDKEKIVCSHENTKFSLDHKKEISSRLEDATTLEHENFILSLLDLSEKFTFLKEICRNDQEFENELEIIEKNLNYLFDFVKDKSSFIFFKNLQYASTGGDEKNIFGFLNFLVSEDMQELTRFLNKFVVQDNVYFEIVFTSLASMPAKTFDDLGRLFNVSSDQDEKIFEILSSFWKGLSFENKRALIQIVNTPLSSERVNSTALIEFITFLTETYPKAISSILEDFSHEYEKGNEFDFLIEVFASETIYKELKSLIKNNGVFDLLNLLTGPKIEAKKKGIEVEFLKERINEKTDINSKCLSDLLDLNVKGYRYGEIIAMMPSSCYQEKESFISKIYQVSKILQNKIELGASFDAFNRGIFSSSFLKLHAALFLSESIKVRYDSQNFSNDLSHGVRTIEDLLLYFDNLALLKPLSKGFVKGFVDLKDVKELILSEKENQEDLEKFNSGLISKDNRSAFISNLKTMLSKLLMNNTDKTLLARFLKAFSADNPVYIPYDRRKRRASKLSVENIIEFLYDQSDDDTSFDVYYFEDETGEGKSQKLNLLERLEIVIREIAFAHNYYGAFFINEVSRAKHYVWKTKKLKLSLKAMNTSIPLFMKMGYVEKDAKRRLLNISNTYNSIYELSYKKPQYSEGHYEDLIQMILTLVVESSDVKSRNLSVFKKPEEELVLKHNADFITSLVNIGSFSRGAKLLKDYAFKTKVDLFQDERSLVIMKWLNQEISKDKNITQISSLLTKLNTEANLNTLWDLIDAIQMKDEKFKGALSEFVGSLLDLMAKKNLSLAPILTLLENSSLKNSELNYTQVLQVLTPGMLKIFTSLIKEIGNSSKISFEKIWSAKELNVAVRKLSAVRIGSFSFSLNNKDQFENILLNYQQAIKANKLNEDDYLYKFLIYLLESDSTGKTTLDEMIDILFSKEGEQIQDFLEDLSEKMTISL